MNAVFLLGYLVIKIAADSEPQREVVLFDKADRNDDGVLTRNELEQVYLLFDTDHDHSITKSEFETDWVTTFALGNSKESDILFSSADINKDGVVNHLDLPGIFTFFDTDDNGQVNINEFLTHWGELKLQAGSQVINIGTDKVTTPTPPTTMAVHP